jgi:hypothetical protein
LVLGAPEQTRPGLHFGISVSLWHFAEVGAAWLATIGNGEEGIETRHGPVTLWGRLSTPRALLSRDKAEGLFLAAQLQYESTHDPFDQGGRLLSDPTTYTAVAEYKWWRIHAAASAGLQLAQGHRYKGLQAGAGLWLTLSKSSGLMVGGEILGRAGAMDGEPGRTGYLALLGIAYKDEFGLGAGVTYLRGDGQELPRHSMLMGMNWSAGRRYKKPPPDLSVPPLWTHADFWYLFGYRDPIVAPDGWIWSDDGKQRLGQYGRAHPWLIQPLLGRRPLPVGAHVLWRPRDGAVRSLEGGLWTFAGYALPGLRLDQGRAIDQALAQALRPPAPRPVVRLPHQLRTPQPGQFPPLSWYGLRGEPSRLEPARSEPVPRAETEPPRTWTPPAPFSLRERPRWTTLHPEDLPPELRGPLLGVWSDRDGCRRPPQRPFTFTDPPQWSPEAQRAAERASGEPETPGPYGHLKEPRTVKPGREFTPAQRRRIVQENQKQHDGEIRDDYTGEALIPAQQSRPGVTPPDNEVHIDHVIPRAEGGTNSNRNARVTSRRYNLDKGARMPTDEEKK